jgi:hypothetical protein
VKWAVENYPAKHYFIDVWDHGSGWHRRALSAQGAGSVGALDISFDDTSGNHITTAQLGQAMAESAKVIGHNVDLYASDACLMAMAEVAQEMAGSVDVFAGSEEVEPGAGWPYDGLLKRWSANGTASPAQVGGFLADEYVKSYTGGSNGHSEVNYSAFDLSKLGKLNAAVADLSAELRKLDKAGRQAAVGAASKATSFEYSDYVDLGDFVDQLDSGRTVDKGLTQSVRDATSEFVIANHFTKKYAKAKGVSIWIPTSQYTLSSYSSAYKALKFDGATHWSDTLSYLLQDGSSSDDNGGGGWPFNPLH